MQILNLMVTIQSVLHKILHVIKQRCKLISEHNNYFSGIYSFLRQWHQLPVWRHAQQARNVQWLGSSLSEGFLSGCNVFQFFSKYDF